jgi:transcriptional regulator with XRE-family HTH domain|nr:MAG TPA: terminase small subunit [Caudoviricetes sp.]
MALGKINEWLERDKLILLEGWARDGLTDEQIAKNIGISRASLYEWKKKEVDIFDALKKGKEVIDFEVENALLKRALGYTITIEEEKLDKYGDVHTLKKDVHVPGDTAAMIFWLKNRRKEQWREKVEVVKTADDLQKINKNVSNIADLLNNPKPNRSEDNVQ